MSAVLTLVVLYPMCYDRMSVQSQPMSVICSPSDYKYQQPYVRNLVVLESSGSQALTEYKFKETLTVKMTLKGMKWLVPHLSHVVNCFWHTFIVNKKDEN